MALSAADRITKANIAIMRDPVFCLFAGLTTVGKTIVTTDIPTACTDGWDKKYNPSFVAQLLDPELRYLVIHELVHMAYSHCRHYRELAKENARMTNIAMDFFVNLMIEDANKGRDFIKFPSVGGVKPDDKYRGWSVRQIYDDLKQQAQQGNPQQGDGPGDGGGFDDHDFSGSSSGDEQGDPAKAQQQAQAQANAIKQALHQGAQMQKKMRGKGDGAGGDETAFGELLQPQVDWRKLLREFVTECASGKDVSTWRKPNRRYLSDDVYLPSLQSETVDEVVVGIDVSGSTWCGQDLPAFGTELASIMDMVKPKKVHVIYWDTAVAGHQTFEDGQFALSECKPVGGGGTTASVLFDYMRKHKLNPSGVVNFTDGEVGSNWGRSDWPTLWCITGNATAPFGTSVKLEV